MDFAQRIEQRAGWIKRLRPERLAPTASLRLEVPAGAWSAGRAGARLARLARATGAALAAEPVLAGRYDGHKGLRLDPSAGLRVGLGGGRSWLSLSADEATRADLAERFETEAGADRARSEQTGFELLDLSGLGVCDWRGTLATPQVARLVLLDPVWQPVADGGSREVFGLVLDFDQRLVDAAQATAFLSRLAATLASTAVP